MKYPAARRTIGFLRVFIFFSLSILIASCQGPRPSLKYPCLIGLVRKDLGHCCVSDFSLVTLNHLRPKRRPAEMLNAQVRISPCPSF